MNEASVDIMVWLTIGCAAVTTYSLRLGGLLLADRLPKTGRFRKFMDALPGTILLSLIVPAAVAEGPVGWLATLATGICSVKTGNVFLSMLVGIGLVAAGRYYGI